MQKQLKTVGWFLLALGVLAVLFCSVNAVQTNLEIDRLKGESNISYLYSDGDISDIHSFLTSKSKIKEMKDALNIYIIVDVISAIVAATGVSLIFVGMNIKRKN